VAFTIEYYHPRVLATIEAWPVDVVANYARLVELLANHGPAIGMPHSRAMGQGLFELRPRGRAVTGRALYCFVQGDRIVIVHAFLKKTRTTPRHDLAIARQRTKEIQRG
jgi:phage-related protein